MTTPESRLQIEQTAPRTLALEGEVDAFTATALQDRLDTLDTTADIEVVLADVSFIDSSGLRVLIAAHRALVDGGHRLTLVEPSAAVNKLLEITGLKEHLEIR